MRELAAQVNVIVVANCRSLARIVHKHRHPVSKNIARVECHSEPHGVSQADDEKKSWFGEPEWSSKDNVPTQLGDMIPYTPQTYIPAPCVNRT